MHRQRSLHRGSIGEALDSEWQTTVDDADDAEALAEALAEDLRAAIARDTYNRHYTLVQVTPVHPPTPLPAEVTGDDLWTWIKEQTCCLNDSDD